MKEEKSNMEPDSLLKAFDQVDDWLEKIENQESEALDTVFLRFCLLKGKEIDYNDVKRKRYPGNPNFWSYYYKPGTPEQYFLMSRELIVTAGDNKIEPTLQITFSGELI